jgi:hypothetical protein
MSTALLIVSSEIFWGRDTRCVCVGFPMATSLLLQSSAPLSWSAPSCGITLRFTNLCDGRKLRGSGGASQPLPGSSSLTGDTGVH